MDVRSEAALQRSKRKANFSGEMIAEPSEKSKLDDELMASSKASTSRGSGAPVNGTRVVVASSENKKQARQNIDVPSASGNNLTLAGTHSANAANLGVLDGEDGPEPSCRFCVDEFPDRTKYDSKYYNETCINFEQDFEVYTCQNCRKFIGKEKGKADVVKSQQLCLSCSTDLGSQSIPENEDENSSLEEREDDDSGLESEGECRRQ
ncbi:hypothetical protein BDZ45DRAFT_797333 [Acephala macrosclerotiorum]|nr:hypothetical protein BDZ45DRAFT_797333 [Acephala macrosclerotiorum]